MFVPDGQSGRSRPERICAGQNNKEGQAILEDQSRLNGIDLSPGVGLTPAVAAAADALTSAVLRDLPAG